MGFPSPPRYGFPYDLQNRFAERGAGISTNDEILTVAFGRGQNSADIGPRFRRT